MSPALTLYSTPTRLPLTMTSKEIASLVEKRHDSVKRTIKTLAENGVIQLPQIVEVEDNQSLSPNSKTKAYVFDAAHKRDTYVVVAQLSPEFTARIVDRWQELEQPPALSPAELVIAQGRAMLALEQQQAENARRLTTLERRVSAMDGDTQYMTVTAFSRVRGLRLPLSEASKLGRSAAAMAKNLEIQIGSVPDERFGKVNSYPVDLLEEVFTSYLAQE